MNLIVAVDENWGIGKNNGLLFDLPDDMRYFKMKTQGKVVCMGYNTLLSFPGQKPLKNRVNIVLAPDSVERDDCIVVHTLDKLFNVLQKFKEDDIYVIGGGMFYKTMLPYCSYAYVTEIYADGQATIFLENLSASENWVRHPLTSVKKCGDLSYSFNLYENLNPIPYRKSIFSF